MTCTAGLATRINKMAALIDPSLGEPEKMGPPALLCRIFAEICMYFGKKINIYLNYLIFIS